MSTQIKLVSLDIDGTLYDPKGSSYDAKKLIKFQLLAKKLRSKGIVPIICTGKPASYVEAFAEAYGLVGKGSSHVCEHGAVIFVYESWKEHYYVDTVKLYASKDYSELEKVVSAMAKKIDGKTEEKMNSASIIYEGAGEDFYSKAIAMIQGLGYSVAESISTLELPKEFCSLAAAGKTDAEIKVIMQKAGKDFCISLSPLTINITPFPLTKAFGLAYIAAKIHKCNLESIVAIGDDQGDIPVFDFAGLSVAVANSDNTTKKFVKEKKGLITKKKSLDGVMDVMKILLKHRTAEDFREHCKSIAA